MSKSKKPTGLSISRSGYNFTCSWKIADADYGGGQQFEYLTKGVTGWRSKWTAIDCGKTATSKTAKLTASTYFPYSGNIGYLTGFKFRVRGNRKKYTSKGKEVNPGWSDWSEKEYLISIPPAPSVSMSLVSGSANSATFSWSVPSLAGNQMFTDVEYQTAYVKNCNYTDGAAAPYGQSAYGGSSASVTYTESLSDLADGNSYTRWVRARARGPAGVSAWVYAKHVYADPNQAANTSVSTREVSGGAEVTVRWNSSAPASRPIDSITIQRTIVTPGAGITIPAGASWSDVETVSFKDGSDAFRYVEDTALADDQCMFVRVNTRHDSRVSYGAAVLAKVGRLSKPTNLSVSAVEQTFRATVTANNASAVTDSFIAIIYRVKSNPQNSYVAGVIPHGETNTTIQCPDWSGESAKAFGAYAVVGTYKKQTRADGSDCYIISPHSGKPLMTSDENWDGGSVPAAPNGVTIEETAIEGTVRVSWNWTWSEADGAELSWADHQDAWESTSGPSTYEIDNAHSASWNISGLEAGKRWYVRVRLFARNGDAVTYGPYCDVREIDLSTAPMIPSLALSSEIALVDGEVTLYWTYVTTDGTDQAYAKICEATIVSGVITYGSVIATTETEQSITIKPTELGWTAGQTHNLCVRVASASGKESEGWSAPVPLKIADPVTCTITETSLETVTVPDDDDQETTRQVLSLTEMPLSIKVTGAGDDKVTTVAIERAADYHMERPDGDDDTGYEGETVFLSTQTGDEVVVVDLSDLYGRLDDGAHYKIVASVIDGYGQEAGAELGFEVHWEHQALMPEAEVEMDPEYLVARITPRGPDGAISTDGVDIYRLSADKPVLIYSGAEFDTPYIDPYPALGPSGGHRIVYKTANGDYITQDNRPAWIDLGDDEGDLLEFDYVVIDFGTDRVILRHNIELSHTWNKDFVETRYLGGSIQGDWNPGISRKSSVQAVVVVEEESDAVEALRRLSVYAGISNIRTPDGSSFCADVQVSEDRSYSTAGKIAAYKLTITRVDPEELCGMKYSEWLVGAFALLDENGAVIVDENGATIIGVI